MYTGSIISPPLNPISNESILLALQDLQTQSFFVRHIKSTQADFALASKSSPVLRRKVKVKILQEAQGRFRTLEQP